ncbi:MarR family winged helix-turn-helix transcriptional regulator [Hydrogenophaga sp.]|uniref:MarR family winged helix-turn-helix transcriptional regulator n=1 Tax=Hydrogenophaga sp. TaxID=1904254 RepID=UPI0027188AB1|nr:MarR family transcriptional regulator [Hydrogenophaga sp.]MDO9433868.1 MarR family transcriptional regulator [Hydrogenophaga sp.]
MREPPPTRHLLRHWREAVPQDRLAHLVRDVARAQMRALQVRLNAHGVSFGHWTFLRILWIQDGLTQRELSDLAGVMEPTTFSAVRAMEGMGLIERRQLEGNRKNVHVFLTDEGRALEKLLVPLAEDVNRASVRGIPERSVAMVRKSLLKMIENLADEEANPGEAGPAVK